MEAKTILRLIKNDIAHLEEITGDFTLESLPSSDEVELSLVRAKALLRELELLHKLAVLLENGSKMTNPDEALPAYHSEQEPFELFESENSDHEQEVEMIHDHEGIYQAEEVQQIELHLNNQQYVEQIPEVSINLQTSEEQITKKDEPVELVDTASSSPIVNENVGADDGEEPGVRPEPIDIIPETPSTEDTTIEETPVASDIPDHKEEIIAEEFREVKKTLNESLGDSHQMVNDILSPEKSDPGYKIIPINSIWDGIGINDRFLFIRELFANSSAKFESTIYALDKLATIQDAVNYLKMNFKWNKTEASQKFLVLVKRRFTK